MAKFVFAYQGGAAPETPEEGEKVMAAWMGWFEQLGAAVVDGGAPFGASSSIDAGGTASAGRAGLTGYSIVEAADLTAATELGKGCPILTSGGSVDVYEAIEM
jgi:hypothetical protein